MLQQGYLTRLVTRYAAVAQQVVELAVVTVTLYLLGWLALRTVGQWGLDRSRLDPTMESALASVLNLAILVVALLVGLDRTLRRGHLGPGRLLSGLLLETVLSALAAPVMMVMHARFVVEVLAGRAVTWSAQQRDADRVSWSECGRAHGPQTLLGGAIAGVTGAFAPALIPVAT